VAVAALLLALLSCDDGSPPAVDAGKDGTRPDSRALDSASADSPRVDLPGGDLSLDTAPPAEMALPDAPPPDAPPPDAPPPDAPRAPDTTPPPDSTVTADTAPRSDRGPGRDGGGPCFAWKDWTNTSGPGICLAICGSRLLACIQASTGIISCDCLIGSTPMTCFSNKPGVSFPGACKTALEVHNCCRP
jgi:hypothetical protein